MIERGPIPAAAAAQAHRVTSVPPPTYIFGAVCPKQGKGAALILPACNTEAMNLHLAEIAAPAEPAAHAVLLADQAGWHMSTRLVVPANVTRSAAHCTAGPPRPPAGRSTFSSTLPRTTRSRWFLIRSSSIVMTLFSGLGVGSVMAAPSRLTWLRLATSKSARFGAASPTYLCERFCTSSGYLRT